ncbi:MAG: glycoside hydrolase family 47 protein, partial [Ferruginibacter sp.]
MKKTIIVFVVWWGTASAVLAQRPAKFSDDLKASLVLAVKDATTFAWNGYKKFAFGKDDVQPLSKSGKNWYNHSMLMTPVDAFDTFLMLGLTTEAQEAKKLILDSLSFNNNNEVQVFEVTIRIVGGLISAYELDGDKRFLQLATDLADRMLPAFASPTGMPYRYVQLQTGAVRDGINNPAE